MNKLILLIGASGSGKSTLRKKLMAADPTLQVHSWDELRLEYAADRVEGFTFMDSVAKAGAAFTLSVEDNSGFSKFYQARFSDQLKNGSVLIDNTNTSAKRRAFFISAARQKNFEIIAYLFPVSKKQLIERANVRTDHKVPIANILQQYMSLQLPSIGEVDQIEFVF